MAIITISRGTMSGGVRLAECLAKRLGYPSLSREILVKAAEKLGVSEEALWARMEGRASFWKRLTEERKTYLIAVQSALADACVDGNLVYHGHAGHLLLNDLPNVLRVRVVAPLAMRIREAMNRDGHNYQAARDYIRWKDEQRVRWTKFVYHLDWRDPANYDFVINLKHTNLNTACAMIAAVVQMPAYATTEAVKKQLHDFALECRVRVALAVNALSRAVSFEVTADSDEVEILGEMAACGVLVRSMGPTEDEVRLIAKTVDGVREARVDLRRYPEFPD